MAKNNSKMETENNGAGNSLKLKRVDEFKTIYATEKVFEEIDFLYKKGSSEKRNYEVWLFRQLQFLDNNALNGLLDRKRVFEDLGVSIVVNSVKYKLYSIRRQHHEGNPRILFTAITDDEGNTNILLVAFHEIKNSDYSKAIEIAKSRINNLLS